MLIAEDLALRPDDRIRRNATAAGPDGVNLDPERLGRLGGGGRGDAARVVLAIGQQHDQFGFCFLVLEAVGRGSQRRANGRAVLDKTDFRPLEILQEPIVVQRERADQIRAPGKGHDTDAVIRSLLDEFLCHAFHRLEPVGPLHADGKILGQHRARHVDDQHDIHAAGLRAGDRFAELRARHGQDQAGQSEIEQTGEEIPGPRTPARADFGNRFCRGE